jgi:PAS domain S-box-containing protein
MTALRRLVEALPFGVALVEGDRVVASEAFARFAGRTPDQLTDLASLRAIFAEHPERLDSLAARAGDLPSPRAELRVARPSGDDCTVELIVVEAPGGTVWMMRPVSATASRNMGSWTTLGSDALDVAARERQHRELSALFDTVKAQVWYLDTKARVVRVNKQVCDVVGMTPEQLRGKSAVEIGRLGEAEERHRDNLAVLASGVPIIGQIVHLRVNGEDRWSAIDKIPVRDERGDVVGLLVFAQDLTAQKRAEAEVRRLNEDLTERIAARTSELHAANAALLHAQKLESIGRLAGGVAHDFNNLLTVILGCGEALRERHPEASEARQLLSAAMRASELTSKLLSFARKHPTELVVADVNTLVHDMHGLLVRTLGEDVDVLLDLAPTPLPALIDRGLLEQTLLSLVINARDALTRGGVIMIVTQLGQTAPRGRPQPSAPQVEISVVDTGQGMTPEVMDHLFEPFFTTKPVGVGTGLGLASAHGVVKQLGGEIWAESAPGRGSTFVIQLPRADGPLVPVRSLRAGPPVAGRGTILVVEDHELVREVTRRTLTRAGYDVRVAALPSEALALVDTGLAIDLVVSDVMMPEIDGPELVRRISSKLPGVRALLVTGYAAEAIAQSEGLEVLGKPFTPAQLAERVKTLMETSSPLIG